MELKIWIHLALDEPFGDSVTERVNLLESRLWMTTLTIYAAEEQPPESSTWHQSEGLSRWGAA
jgi:hypothetical protein